MSEFIPSLTTREYIRELLNSLLEELPGLLGIDEAIPNCEIIDMDPDGVGTFPRYITCRILQYYQNVMYRGGLGLGVGDYVTVLHFRKGDFYEVLAPGGSGGTAEVPLWALGDYYRGYMIRGGAADWEAFNASLYGHILVGDGTDVNSVDAHGDADILADGEIEVQRIRGRTVADIAPGAGEVLTWDAGQTRWEPAAGGGGGLGAPVARGDMIRADAVPAWIRFAKGLAHQMLKMDAAGNDPGWEAFDWDEMAGVAGADMVHAHSAAAEGGTLDWDLIWADAVHSHANAGEGGQLDWDLIWTDAVHNHLTNAEGGVVDKISEGGTPRVEVSGTNVIIQVGTVGAGFLQLLDRLGFVNFQVDDAGAIIESVVTAVRVYRNANQSIPNNTLRALSFTTEVYDLNDNNWVIGNPTQLSVAGSEGVFQIEGGAVWANNVNGRRWAGILLNGATYIAGMECAMDAAGRSSFNLSTQYRLTGTDYVELIVYQTSGGNLNILTAANPVPYFAMYSSWPLCYINCSVQAQTL
jgi:hypothetical protein